MHNQAVFIITDAIFTLAYFININYLFLIENISMEIMQKS